MRLCGQTVDSFVISEWLYCAGGSHPVVVGDHNGYDRNLQQQVENRQTGEQTAFCAHSQRLLVNLALTNAYDWCDWYDWYVQAAETLR